MKRPRLSATAFALLLTLAYLAVAGAVVSRHEIWRDEAQAFLMAKDSRSISDLFHRLKYDIHPPLWHLVLFFLTRIASAPAAMQVLHVAVAAAAVFLFARFAPFSRPAKALFALSYYALFEYGVISRNYAPGMLFLFLFCALYPRRKERFLLLCASLALLSLTSIHAIILAAALTLALLAERMIRRASPRPRLFWAGIALSLAGIAAAVVAAFPHPESIYAGKTAFVAKPELILPVLRTIPKAFLPLPVPQWHFWNTALVTYLPAPEITVHLLAVIILLFSLFLFRKHLPALVYFALATSVLAVFFFFNYFGYLRHHGFFFLVFLSASWMAFSRAETPSPAPSPRLHSLDSISSLCRRAAPAALTILLGVQALAGLYAAARDVRDPFSQGKATASYLLRHGLTDHVLVGDIDYTMSSISAYLGRPIYHARDERWGTYKLNAPPPRRRTDMDHIVRAAERLSRKTGKDYLLILNYPLSRLSLTSRSLRPVGASVKAVVEDESYYLYKKIGLPPGGR
jgi:hypothetical protein